MGLDISVLMNAVFVGPPNRESRGDLEYIGVYDTLFPERADGYKCGMYEGQRGHRFRAGSYSGYNTYRNLVSEAMLGAPAEVVWKHEEKYKDNPFWLQVNFADNEGTIGPKTSKILSDAYNDPKNRAKFEAFLKTRFVDQADVKWELESWDDWALAFKQASESNGLVSFH